VIAAGRCRHGAPEFARILLLSEQRLVAAAIARLLSDAPLSATVDIHLGAAPLEDVASYDLVVCQLLERASRVRLMASMTGLAPLAPVVVLDDVGEEATLSEFLERGASGVLTNDCSYPELLDCINETLSGSRWIGSSVIAWLIRSATPGANLRARRLTIANSEGGSESLTNAERAILDAVASGMTAAQAARARSISIHTVRNHLASAYRKLRVHSRAQAVLAARALDARHSDVRDVQPIA
jgi:DNA-binding NarL/FixJ family response regulator